ncbi:type I-F CRISPR-associated protein Csy3 [Allochromatium tepidum]|uniref:CRISPR-associated protein Csy3 n=1 Tax=Allochromatium tepidum TaxID=553982 RepID=A0ABN6GEV8_9GAMM|nr:type I-F CRISPR-associated protein Csy3 [Allochromatium tepidum]BCU08482.1 CRISPR-associated protein Csy3 [Allochromatium tepidum]
MNANQISMFDQSEVFKNLPGVLSFQRGIPISDGLFFNELDDGSESPVMVVRHGIRGTQNVAKGTKKQAKKGRSSSDSNSSESESLESDTVDRGVSNIQTTDTAKMDPQASALKVRFSMSPLDLDVLLFAVAAQKDEKDLTFVKRYRESVKRFIVAAKASSGLDDVANRIARNVLTGRWLWRNRTVAQSIEIKVSHENGELISMCNALSLSLKYFDDITETERKLGALIAENFRGNARDTFAVEARVDLGIKGAVEVFPSQNYVEKKPDGFARSLYCVGHPRRFRSDSMMELEATREMGQAALRDQKISNALRTIDTWYPAYNEHQRPIPVEPFGANLDAQAFFRDKKTSAFEYARRFNELDPNSPEGKFMIANLIRGGVLSSGEKE